ncbi:MAG: Gfo/Idh/MocA family oxidoreductase [Capsulimonadales bacterium]|nr:Gfo/Idh/MocA family oxidoreductase [Capsulimonadales bacterium]
MENVSSPLRLGIVGAGHIGARHALHASRLPDTVVAAVADPHLEKADAIARPLGAVSYASADALLATEVDAVIVAVPTHLHRTLSEQALAAGKHVLCEKPLALTTEDCDALIEAAERANRTLAVGQVLRFFPEYEHARRRMESGAIGHPAAIRLRRAGRYPETPWFADESQSGGLLLDLLIHEFDFLRWCFGPVTRVFARTLSERRLPRLDYALVTVRHANGVLAHVEGVWGEPGGTHTAFEIAGDAGLLTHDSHLTETLRTATWREDGTGKVVFSAPLMPTDDPYYRQLAAFVDRIRRNEPPSVSAQDARQAVAIARAARESARTGQPVSPEGENV